VVGAVYDRGYRGYEGVRGGRTAARAALFRASVRRALGFRRPWRQKVAPMALLAIATVPAIVFVGVGYITRDTPAADFEWITYREYVGVSNSLLVFVALTAPDIMCPDRRQRVLPLLFARPLTGADYVIAKVGAMFAILFAFSFLPQVVLFLGQMLVSDDGALRYARDNAEVIWQVPIAVAVLSIFYAAVGVAIASLTTRRIIAGATIIGLFLVTSIVSSVLVGQRETESVQPVPTAPPSTVITPDGEVEVVPADPGAFDPDEFDPDGETDVYFVRREPSAAALVDLLTLPLIVRDLVFLGHVEVDHPLSGLEGGGALAALELTVIVILALWVLLRRYREVER
jgi:ABC-2 type transport system permease protein